MSGDVTPESLRALAAKPSTSFLDIEYEDALCAAADRIERLLDALDREYRKGWDDGYDAGWSAGEERSRCDCKPGEGCAGVEDIADGSVDTCWYCTFLNGEEPCPAESEGTTDEVS